MDLLFPLFFVLVGLTLVANPVYIGSITIYPNGGVIFVPFHSATITIGGLLLVITGAERTIRLKERHSLGRVVTIVMLASISLFILIETFMILYLGTDSGYTIEYGIRKTVLAACIVGVFSFAASIRTQDVIGMSLSIGVLTLFLLIGMWEWQFDPLLGPVLDFWFLLTGGPIFGIKYSGSLLILLIFTLGLWVGGIDE